MLHVFRSFRWLRQSFEVSLSKNISKIFKYKKGQNTVFCQYLKNTVLAKNLTS